MAEMNNEEVLIEQIDAFLDGTMSEVEAKAFEVRLKEENNLQEALEAQKKVRAWIDKHGMRMERMAQLEQIHSQLEEVNPFDNGNSPSRSDSPFNRNTLFALAASIVLILALGIIFWNTSAPNSSKEFADNTSIVKIPVLREGRSAKGLAGSAYQNDSIITLLASDPAYNFHYKFAEPDELILYGVSKTEVNNMLIQIDSTGVYRLQMTNSSYILIQGRNSILPLE